MSGTVGHPAPRRSLLEGTPTPGDGVQMCDERDEADASHDSRRPGLEHVGDELGIRVPPITLASVGHLPARSFSVRLNHLEGAPWRALDPGQRLLQASLRGLAGLPVRVLATTRFPTAGGPHVGNGTVDMPVVWTKMYGQGRVFYNSLGHQANIVAMEPVLKLMRRGVAWAARREP
jgi:hypothetical protein